jgi:hypothetical protein
MLKVAGALVREVEARVGAGAKAGARAGAEAGAAKAGAIEAGAVGAAVGVSGARARARARTGYRCAVRSWKWVGRLLYTIRASSFFFFLLGQSGDQDRCFPV